LLQIPILHFLISAQKGQQFGRFWHVQLDSRRRVLAPKHRFRPLSGPFLSVATGLFLKSPVPNSSMG